MALTDLADLTVTPSPQADVTHSVRIGPVAADPYPWPYDTSVSPVNLAVINIDWQVDFCGPGGYVDRMGYDIGLTRAGLEPTQKLLSWARDIGALIIHTREGHPPDLSDLPANKRWRSARIGAEIGSPGPTGRLQGLIDPGQRSGAGRVGIGSDHQLPDRQALLLGSRLRPGRNGPQLHWPHSRRESAVER